MTPNVSTLFIHSLQHLWPEAENYYLWGVVPLVIAISIVYKGTKVTKVRELPLEATKLAIQILVVMVLAAVLLYGVVETINRYAVAR